MSAQSTWEGSLLPWRHDPGLSYSRGFTLFNFAAQRPPSDFLNFVYEVGTDVGAPTAT